MVAVNKGICKSPPTASRIGETTKTAGKGAYESTFSKHATNVALRIYLKTKIKKVKEDAFNSNFTGTKRQTGFVNRYPDPWTYSNNCTIFMKRWRITKRMELQNLMSRDVLLCSWSGFKEHPRGLGFLSNWRVYWGTLLLVITATNLHRITTVFFKCIHPPVSL